MTIIIGPCEIPTVLDVLTLEEISLYLFHNVQMDILTQSPLLLDSPVPSHVVFRHCIQCVLSS